MRRSNICKFIEMEERELLTVRNFVRETNGAVMRAEERTSRHRAILVRTSSITFVVDGEESTLATGDLLFIFSGETYRAIPTDDSAEYMFVSFDGGRAHELFSRFNIHKSNRVFRGNNSMIPFWSDSLFGSAENADLAAESVLIYTFSRLSDVTRQTDGAVERAVDIIDEYFSDQELTLASVAAQLGYNKKYLSQVFKREKGVSISDYVRNLRIQHAVFLLDHGIDSVKNVAALSGFKDPFHFSKIFKSVMGVSPTDYKKK